MKIEILRKLVGREEIDYTALLSALAGYAQPRAKISLWLKKGELIRVKKGLYIFGPSISHHLHRQEALANLIYGPSALSPIAALSFYGLIPERTTIQTNVTPKRKKVFYTPVGTFIYYYLNPKKYSIGIKLDAHILIASKEKALCDQIYFLDQAINFSQISDVENYLLYDLRIERSELKKFNISLLKEIATMYHDHRLNMLTKFLKRK